MVRNGNRSGNTQVWMFALQCGENFFAVKPTDIRHLLVVPVNVGRQRFGVAANHQR